MPTILIVDDSKIFLRGITLCLQEAGFSVISASTGEEGVRLARDHKPSMILLDMFLPRLDGMMVMRVLNSTPETRGIPVLVISANGNHNDVHEAKRLGVVGYMSKSAMVAEDLVATIHTTLGRSPSAKWQVAVQTPAP